MKREIDVSDDLKFTRSSWRVERVGWGFLAALLLAGVLGFLGPGLFSRTTARGPVTVEYERFARLENEGQITVRLAAGARNLWVENRYLRRVRILGVRPEPARVAAQPGWTVFTFAAEEDVEARLDVEHQKMGRARGRFGTSPDRTVEIRQFVYP